MIEKLVQYTYSQADIPDYYIQILRVVQSNHDTKEISQFMIQRPRFPKSFN